MRKFVFWNRVSRGTVRLPGTQAAPAVPVEDRSYMYIGSDTAIVPRTENKKEREKAGREILIVARYPASDKNLQVF